MSANLKLAVVITGDASSLKAAAESGKVSVSDLGATATAASAGLASLESHAVTAAAATTKAAAAMGAVANANRSMRAEIERSTGVVREVFNRDRAADIAAYGQQLDAIRAKWDPLFAAAQRQKQILLEITEAERIGAIGGAAALQARLRATVQYNNALSQNASAPSRSKQAAESLVSARTVTVDRGADIKAYGAEMDALRAKYNPLFAAGQEYKAQLAEIRQAHKFGALSTAEMTAAVEKTKTAFADQVGDLNRTAKASGFASHEISNLRSQAIDIGTMFSMGASPFQIISSQAGQIYEVMAGAKGGVTGALKTMGSTALNAAKTAAAALGPWGLGLAAVTAGVGVLAYTFRSKVEPLEDVIERQEKAVLALEKAYKIAGLGAEDLGKRADASLAANASQAQTEALKRLKADTEAQVTASFSGLGNRYRRENNNLAELRGAFEDFVASVRRDDPDLKTLDERLGAIRLKAGDNGQVRELADEIENFVKQATPLVGVLGRAETALSKTAVEALKAKGALKSLNEQMGSLLPNEVSPTEDINRIYNERMAALERSRGGSARSVEGSAQRFARERNDALRELNRASLEDLMETEGRREDITKSSTDRQVAEIERGYERRIAAARKANNAIEVANLEEAQANETATVRAEAARAEASRRAGYELDVRAITARTAAQKADIEAERARQAALEQNLGATVAAQRAEEARTLSMSQAREGLAEGTRQQSEASERQIAQAQLELQLVGKSAGETARLRAEFELLAQAKDLATSSGFDASTVQLTDSMRAQAAEIGRLTSQTQRLNFERDLLFDRQQASRSPEEQRIAEQLRAIGVEYDSAQGKQDAAQLRFNNRLHETNEALQSVREAGKDAFLDLVDAIGSGEDAIGGLMKAASSLFKQFSSAGFDRLSKMIFGGGSETASGGSGLAAILTSGANVARTAVAAVPNWAPSAAVPTPTSRPEFVGQAAAAVTGKVMTAAKQFNSGVDSRLMTILETAAQRFPGYNIEAISGVRSKGTGQHTKGMAADVRITNAATGQVYNNYQNGPDFRVHEQFAQIAKTVQTELFPSLEKLFTFGGYFQGPKGKYGALDSMHFDLGGANRMQGGSWENGLTAKQRAYFPGVESVGMSKQDLQRVVTRGTSDGVQTGITDAARNTSSTSSAAQGTMRQLGGGQQALAGIGGIIGAFSGGYESGSPLSGGLSGAMGGFELGSSLSFLGAAGGPIGAGVGLVAGILGGVLGGRAKRKAAHQESAAQWDALKPEYTAWKRSLTGEGTGELRAMNESLQGNFDKFTETGGKAWKYGTGNSTAEFASSAKLLYDKVAKALVDFRETFGAISTDLANGAGLDGPFAKGRASAKAIETQIKGFIDDVKIAFGSMDNGLTQGPGSAASDAAWAEERDKAVKTAQEAATDYALSILDGGNALSDVASTLQGLRGIAAGLSGVLTGLGNSAEDTASKIAGKLSSAIAKVKDGFVEGYQRSTNELTGVGYFNDVADLLKEMTGGLADAALLGVDASLVTENFKLQAQEIVNGAELTGEAFTALITKFPELKGVVNAFGTVASDTGAVVARTAKELASAIRDYDDRLFAATNDTSTQAGQIAAFERQAQRERETEIAAGGGAMAQLEAALAAERLKIVRDANTQIEASYKSFLDDRLSDATQKRADAEAALLSRYQSTVSWVADLRARITQIDLGDTSSLSGKEKVEVARARVTDLAARAQGGDVQAQEQLLDATDDLLRVSRAYNVSSEAFYADQRLVKGILETTASKTQSQLDTLRQSNSFLSSIDDNTASLSTLLEKLNESVANQNAAQKLVDGNRSFGINTERNRLIDAGLKGVGLNFTGNYGMTNGQDQFLQWRTALPPEQLAVVNGIISQYIGINRASGGLVTGPGTKTSDSVRLNASHGEYVVSAAAVQSVGPDVLDHINHTGTLPRAAMASLRAGSSGTAGNDNSAAVLVELQAMRAAQARLLPLLITTVGQGNAENVAATERGNRSAADVARDTRRAAALQGTRAA